MIFRQTHSLDYVTGITRLKIKELQSFFQKKYVNFFKSVTRIIELETSNLEKLRSSILKKLNIKGWN